MKIVRCFIHCCLLLMFFVPLMPSSAQSSVPTTHIFTWRPAALSLEYPIEWQAGTYEDIAFLTSSADGYAKAVIGSAPEEPSLAFYYYPATATLEPNALLTILFPSDAIPSAGSLGDVPTTEIRFVDNATNQSILAIAFRSPATRHSAVIAAIAPTDKWDNFQPVLDAMLSSVQFYTQTAQLELFGTKALFEYSRAWVQATNGQVVVAAPTIVDAEAILTGNLNAPFIRAQLLTPSGIGVDADDPSAAETILLRFAGLPEDKIEILTRFEWAEGMPAAAAWLELNGVRLALVAVINDDTALLIGGGAPAEQWDSVRAQVLTGLNLTFFVETPSDHDLTRLILGSMTNDTTRRFGMVID